MEYWLRLAAYDLDTARALLASGRDLPCAFWCHQVVEKLLKAHVVRSTGRVPPRTHDLVRLAAESAIDLDDRRREVLGRLGPLAILARYPATDDPSSLVDHDVATRLVADCEEVDRWLRSILG